MTSYESLPPETRVWIYQSNRPLTEEEVKLVKPNIQNFATKWISHSRDLRAFADILHNQFIVLMVDESQAGASGCSIDSSVHYLQSLQRELGIDLFDRMNFAWKSNDTVKTANRDEFARLYQAGEVTDETLVFDNLVNTKASFEAKWIKPLKESWHTRMV